MTAALEAMGAVERAALAAEQTIERRNWASANYDTTFDRYYTGQVDACDDVLDWLGAARDEAGDDGDGVR